MRRELAPSGVEVGETRSLADCWNALAASPASFLVVELDTAGAEDLLGRMVRQERDFPSAQVGRGGRPRAGRLAMARARGGGRPFHLLAAATERIGRAGLPPPGQHPRARNA